MTTKKSIIPIVIVLIVVLVAGGAAVLMYASPNWFVQGGGSPPPAAHLKMGGTSVAFLIIENRWKGAYRKDKGVEVEYESTGSTKGLYDMIDKKYAVAFTHAPMSDEQKKSAQEKGGGVVHIPMVLCAVAPIYNLKDVSKDNALRVTAASTAGLQAFSLNDGPLLAATALFPGRAQDKPLKFSGEVLGKIFRGLIDKWNNPELQGLQDADVVLPDEKIIVVHREDSSGTTFIFTQYLAGASDSWKQKFPKPSSEIQWEVGEGRQRNEGVAQKVQETEGAIGYVDLVHAWNYNLAYGKVQNQKGEFIHAEAKTMTAAAKTIVGEMPEDLTFKLTNRPGEDSYPITGTIWAVCYQVQPAADHQRVVDFLHWAAHEGQQFAENMSYAPLPPEIVERVDKKLDTITASP